MTFRNVITLLLISSVVLIYCSDKKSGGLPDAFDGFQDSIPPVPDSIIIGMRKYHNTRSANLSGWLPDGKGMVILTRFAETNQLHVVYTPGGARYQKTFRSEEIFSPAVCPDPSKKLVVFSQDSGGNEQFQLHALDLVTMKSRIITDGHSSNRGVVWSNRGDRFAFHSTKRNGRDWDIYICRADSHFTVSLQKEVCGMYSVLDWSPDDRELLVQQFVSGSFSRLYVFDLDTKTMVPLNTGAKEASVEEAFWDCDGKGVFYTSDEKYDNRTLCYYRIADRKERVLTAELSRDVRYLSISSDRRKLAFMTNEHGYLGVYLLDTKTLVFKRLDFLPVGIIGSIHFHPGKNMLGCSIRKADLPGDIYTIDLDTDSVRRWTFSEYGELDSSNLATPDLIAYPTFDSVDNQIRRIPAYYYRPAGEGPFPVLVFIHGGPETQYWPSFSPSVQYFINEMHVAVVAPNIRGSGGYGKKYLELDNGLHREDAVKDIGALLDWIAIQPDLDSTRIAVMGGSYGGYMTLASLVHFNERLKAGVDLYGISDFITFLENTASYRRDLRRVEYGDERDSSMRAFFKEISPVSNASKIKAPLLIIQGANDPRVPASESMQIANAVRKNGKPVWMFIAPDEGHGFRKKSNKEYQDYVTVMFLKRFLAVSSGNKDVDYR